MKKKQFGPVFIAFVVCTFFLTGCATTSDKEMAEMQTQLDQAAQNKAVMHKFVELFVQGNWGEDLPKVIAGDCILHHPGGEDVVGLDAMMANWADFFPRLTDMQVTTHAEISEGDILLSFMTWSANYVGEVNGRQVSGVPVKFNQVEMVRIEDGKIAEYWVEYDELWMMEQLGMELVWM